MAAEHGIEIEPEEARRNVLTRGIDLNALVGQRFFVGEVECRGDRRCDPCYHLQKLTQPGRAARSRRTAAACGPTSLGEGTIRVGDRVGLPPPA